MLRPAVKFLVLDIMCFTEPLRLVNCRSFPSTYIKSYCLTEDINPRPAGPLDFPPPDGGGGVRKPPSLSAPAHRRAKLKTEFEISLKIIPKLLRSFLSSGQN